MGTTDNIKRRTGQHNRCLRINHHGKLYTYLSNQNVLELKLEVFKTFSTRWEANMFECVMILLFYFSGSNTLQQGLPKSVRYR